MSRSLFGFAVAVAVLFGSMSTSSAQEFPGLGVGNLFEMNAQFDAQFDAWARRGSWEVARQLPDHVSSAQIIGAMNPYTVENTYGDYNRSWWNNQARTIDAVERWDSGAIRGDANFYDYNGFRHVLPYNAGGYHYGNDGYLYEGHGNVDYGQNLYWGF